MLLAAYILIGMFLTGSLLAAIGLGTGRSRPLDMGRPLMVVSLVGLLLAAIAASIVYAATGVLA